MTLRSLRLRLLVGAAIWIVLALAATGILLLVVFHTYLFNNLQTELRGAMNRVLAMIDSEVESVVLRGQLVDDRYETQFSGYYWQVEDQRSGDVARSRSLWDVQLEGPVGAHGSPKMFPLVGPRDQPLAAMAQDVAFDNSGGSRTYTIIVARDRSYLEDTVRRFATEMGAYLLVVAIALIAAAWLQVHVGLRPLSRLAKEVEAIRHGTAPSLSTNHPEEVQPLVREVNELIAAHESSVRMARERAADLAHGLKTPLAVVASTVDKLRESGDDANADSLERIVAEMTERVDYQLRLARLRPRSRSQVLSASLQAAVLRTISVLRKTHDGENLFWQADLGNELSVDMDSRDLIELVGVVLENAAKWAAERVDVSARQVGANAELVIADDGQGLTPEQIAQLGVRGRRLDETRPGTGLGLSIAKEILALNGGTMTMGRSAIGGLSVKLTLPISGEPLGKMTAG